MIWGPAKHDTEVPKGIDLTLQTIARQFTVILALGLLGWALCGAIMFVGMAVTDIQTTLVVHLVGAPLVFATISWFYFRKYYFTSPLQTAVLFLSIVIFMDFFIVALVINKSMDMFREPMGTWLPFLFIFLATYLTGRLKQKARIS